ncbi:hypothetical protein [Amycolatopsis magusensis]|uniref:hypothetical protein n=1 Tax=Amycolatopsis magusensis TaxID=882444 RepID=UPI0024A87727|nr:hypothetical protein [Amycolatopsis magusensis]MDI5975598.1 hypothetical protein [Amycolatopsis magusensis]
MNTVTTPRVAPARWADRTGRTVLAVDTVATLGAFATGIPLVLDAADEHVLTEFWRTTAYLVFAGLFTLLAVAPRKQRGLWELILVHKIAVTGFALIVIDKPAAVLTAAIDGVLVLTVVAAYVLCRGWRAWRPAQLDRT